MIHLKNASVSGDLNVNQTIFHGTDPAMFVQGSWRLVDYLKKIASESQNSPSWSDFLEGRVWPDDPVLPEIDGRLQKENFAFIVGSQGTGKTAVARTVAYRLYEKGYEPTYWDFEHLGLDLPITPSDFWYGAVLYAQSVARKPLLILENVHLNARLFQTILSMQDVSLATPTAPMLLIATSRTPELNPGLSDRLRRVMVLLGTTDQNRGERFLNWWLEHILHLDAPARRQIREAVPWSRYMHDFWVLKLALQAFDVQSRSLPMWAIERMLADRLSPTINANPGIDDLLYLMSGLGRTGIATDLDAAARVLGKPIEDIRLLVEKSVKDGLISVDKAYQSCRFWHDSLAECYWDMFALERGRWAGAARKRFGILAP